MKLSLHGCNAMVAATLCILVASCEDGAIRGGSPAAVHEDAPDDATKTPDKEPAQVDHWAFKAPVAEVPPSADGDGWVANDIDAFVAQHLRDLGQVPGPQAAPEKLLRRLTISLTGLPPTLEELDAFIADPSDGAYEATVDRLLASPRYAEHMLAGWLDLARYADTDGYQYDYNRPAWPFRDWALQALNDNLPFDEFTIKQLAGDLLPDPTDSDLLATSFNRNHAIQGENGLLKDEFRDRYVADRVETLGRAWLGLTVECARCHDHKYDPTTADDYYSLYDCFNHVPESDNGPNSDFAPSMPLDSPLQERIATDLAKRMKTRSAEEASDAELEWLQYEADMAAMTPLARIMQDENDGRETRKLAVGRYDAPFGDPLHCAPPHFLPPFPEDAPKNRLGLAQWLVSANHPLTARVAVNRLWHQHFGRGLVPSLDNFGTQVPEPAYRDLLDWLALRFIDSGWDLKAMHRLIVTSSTFKQRSALSADESAADSNNNNLARGPRFRLPAEVIRDLILSASGLLVERLGGPPVYPYQPAGVWEELSFEDNPLFYPFATGDGLYRRSIYSYWKRTLPPPFMSLFDAPDREQSLAMREPTTTAEQALALMNGEQFLEAARHLASNAYADAGGQADKAIELAFRRLTSRVPNEQESGLLMELYQQQQETLKNEPAAIVPLLTSGRSAGAATDPDVAALTQVARVLLNLGETITQE